MQRSWVAEVLLLMSWGLGPEDPQLSDACFHALVEETKTLPPWLSTLGYDAGLGAISQLLSLVHYQPANERSRFFSLIARRLKGPDVFRAMQRFAR
jgi:hypothetical protein